MKQRLIALKSAGFTIIELMIVVVIIGILVTIVVVAYNGVQSSARDSSVLSDIDNLDGIETQCSLNRSACGISSIVPTVYAKAWYSGSGVDSYLKFTPSAGNVIDVVSNSTDYCIRAYNPLSSTYKTLDSAALKESTQGVCATLSASASAVLGSSTGSSNTFANLTWTQQTAAGSRNWKAIASSQDGTKLAAVVSGGYIYTSTDSGATWTQRATSLGTRSWTNIASSSDGSKLVAVGYTYIYTSTDSGATWTQRATSQYWESVASSLDGAKLFAGTNTVYVSTDSGATWATTSSPWAGSGYSSITVSSGGSKVAAANNGGYIYTSTDSGATWTSRTGTGSSSWGGMVGSIDGAKLFAYPQGNAIWRSTDSGVTWNQSSAGSGYCNGIAGSWDGSKLIASYNGTYVYTSTNSGATWSQSTLPASGCWQALGSSSDGTKVVAGMNGGYIYTGLYD